MPSILFQASQTYLIRRFGVPRQELLVNYRSNQDLVEYAKSLGYPAQLTAFKAKKNLQLVYPVEQAVESLPGHLPVTGAYAELLAPSRSVVALIHDDPVSSQANEFEAGIVAGLAFCVRRSMARELDTGEGGTQDPVRRR